MISRKHIKVPIEKSLGNRLNVVVTNHGFVHLPKGRTIAFTGQPRCQPIRPETKKNCQPIGPDGPWLPFNIFGKY